MTRWNRPFFPLLLLCLMAGPWVTARAQDFPEGSTEALSEFAEGMKFYTAQQYSAALPHLYKAQELDNSFVVSLFFAALCEGNLASGVPTDSLYRIVLAERARLSPYYVYRAESQLAQTQGDRPRAFDFALKAADLAPGSKAWYNVAYMAVRLNRPGEARAALLRLDPKREPMEGWRGYWGVLARAYDALGRYDEVLQNAADLREAYPNSRTPFWWEVAAYGAMGDVDGLNRVFEAAAATPATASGNTVGVYMRLAGSELAAHGYPEEAVEMYNRTVEWYKDQGDAVSGHFHQRLVALALIGAARLEEAAEVVDRILAQRPADNWYHGSAGMIAARMENWDRYETEKAYIVGQAADHVPPWLPNFMGYFLANEGRAEEAVAALEAGMAQGYAFNASWHRDPAFDLIRDHPAFQELIRIKG